MVTIEGSSFPRVLDIVDRERERKKEESERFRKRELRGYDETHLANEFIAAFEAE